MIAQSQIEQWAVVVSRLIAECNRIGSQFIGKRDGFKSTVFTLHRGMDGDDEKSHLEHILGRAIARQILKSYLLNKLDVRLDDSLGDMAHVNVVCKISVKLLDAVFVYVEGNAVVYALFFSLSCPSGHHFIDCKATGENNRKQRAGGLNPCRRDLGHPSCAIREGIKSKESFEQRTCSDADQHNDWKTDPRHLFRLRGALPSVERWAA